MCGLCGARNPTLPSDRLLAQYAPVAAVDGCGGLVVHQAPDVFALWRAWEQESGCECDTPFWAVAWSAAIVLARFVLEGGCDVSDRTVIDLGCGGALAGIAAAKTGASRVIANDTDPVALHVAGRNASANGVSLETVSDDLIAAGDACSADIVLVGDMYYHRSQAQRTTEMLQRMREAGTQVFIADGGRPFAPVRELRCLAEFSVNVNSDLEGVSKRRVHLYAVP